MMPVFQLWVLATLDAALSGYRVASGRNSLICKRRYLTRACVQCGLLAQVCVVVFLAELMLLIQTADDPAQLRADLVEALRCLHQLFIPYALVCLVALVLRVTPSVDVRSTLNILIYGPFTLIRPAVGLVGVGWAWSQVPCWQVPIAGLSGLALMLGFEQIMNRWHARSFAIAGRTRIQG